MGDHGGLSGLSTNRWTAQLPVDFRRSAQETFRNMRSCGCVTVRDWMSQSYTWDRRSDVWIDLWTLATTIDFRVADAASHGDEAVIARLNSDDTLELAFRRLSASIHVDRTGDHAAGLRMLGQPAPGTKSAVAPSWWVEECTMHSKNEHQRDERTGRRRKGKGEGKSGKADKKGGGSGRDAK